jgi:hypothetical protein
MTQHAPPISAPRALGPTAHVAATRLGVAAFRAPAGMRVGKLIVVCFHLEFLDARLNFEAHGVDQLAQLCTWARLSFIENPHQLLQCC